MCLTSRDIIRNAVNASEHDSVIFVGNGVTGGVHKLIHALDLKKPPVTMSLLFICMQFISARVVYYKSLQSVNFAGNSRKFCQLISQETKCIQNAFSGITRFLKLIQTNSLWGSVGLYCLDHRDSTAKNIASLREIMCVGLNGISVIYISS